MRVVCVAGKIEPIWGFGVGYLGLFADLRGLSGVIFPTSWNFLGDHDNNNRSGDTARHAGGGTKSVIIIIFSFIKFFLV